MFSLMQSIPLFAHSGITKETRELTRASRREILNTQERKGILIECLIISKRNKQEAHYRGFAVRSFVELLRCLYLGLGRKQIADAHFGKDVPRMGRVRFQLPAQTIDVYLEHVALSEVIRSPHMFQ